MVMTRAVNDPRMLQEDRWIAFGTMRAPTVFSSRGRSESLRQSSRSQGQIVVHREAGQGLTLVSPWYRESGSSVELV